VRAVNIPPDLEALFEGKEDEMFTRLTEEAQRAIDEDGAGVIVLASTTMWQAHDYLQERLPVPVINPGVWAVKMAELFVRLGKSHSKTDYPAPPEPIDETIFAALRGT
jgi:allantoin racemase